MDHKHQKHQSKMWLLITTGTRSILNNAFSNHLPIGVHELIQGLVSSRGGWNVGGVHVRVKEVSHDRCMFGMLIMLVLA